jgi:hypothetical protein
VGLNRFDELRQVLIEEDLITSDGYLAHTISCPECTYLKSDFTYRRGIWRGEEQNSLLRSKRGVATNLIVGHSDQTFSKRSSFLAYAKGFKYVSGINVLPIEKLAKSIPLGLTNPTNESAAHLIFGNHSHLEEAISIAQPKRFKASYYANFSLRTNFEERDKVKKILEKIDSPFTEPLISDIGRIEYLKSLRQYDLVICPAGNGVDTHRIWETLYMGGTPAVLANPIINPLVADLPVLVLQDWSELFDSKRIERMWNELDVKNYNFNKLRLSYWINEMCILRR